MSCSSFLGLENVNQGFLGVKKMVNQGLFGKHGAQSVPLEQMPAQQKGLPLE